MCQSAENFAPVRVTAGSASAFEALSSTRWLVPDGAGRPTMALTAPALLRDPSPFGPQPVAPGTDNVSSPWMTPLTTSVDNGPSLRRRRMDRHHDSDDENVDGGGSGETVLTERQIEVALEAGGEERDEERDRNRRRERRQQAHPGTEPRVPTSCREHRPEPGGRQGERDEMMLPERRPRERAREQQQPRRGDAPPP